MLRRFDVAEEATAPVLRALDKVEKEDEGAVLAELQAQHLSAPAAAELYGIIATRRETAERSTSSGGPGTRTRCSARARRAAQVVEAIRQLGVPDRAFAIDLGVVRGLDYYTGTVYETAPRRITRYRQHLLRRPL